MAELTTEAGLSARFHRALAEAAARALATGLAAGEMMREDLKEDEKDALCRREGFSVAERRE